MMKVSRRTGEAVELTVQGVTILVHVQSLDNGTALLGIDAPQSVRITYRHLNRARQDRLPQRHTHDRVKPEGCES